MRKWVLLMGSVMAFSTVNAAQVKVIRENQTVNANISSVDVTRIFVAGDRIKSIRGIKGAYTRENDEANGEVYIRPTASYQNRAFTVLITTENDRHFTLLLNPLAVPSDTIMVLFKDKASLEKAAKVEKASPYEKSLIELAKSMVAGVQPEGYSTQHVISKQFYRLNQTGYFNLIRIYKGAYYQGEVFKFTNRGASTFELDERSFYSDGTRLVAIESNLVPAHASTLVYRIRDHV